MNSTQAIVDVVVEFYGRAAHAAADPWNGRSAVDAVEAFAHGINLMREHIRPTSRLHYTLAAGGDVPNVVPEYGKVWIWARDWKRSEVESLTARVRKVAEGAAIMTETSPKVTIRSGIWERLTNDEGEKLLDSNLRWLGPAAYTPEEQEVAKSIQRAAGVPDVGMNAEIRPLQGQEQEGGSTDLGDVSWIVPTLHATIATVPKGVPWHAWPVVAASGMSIGHKGMLRAAKTLAATMVDLYEQPKHLKAIRADFEKKKGNVKYRAYVPEGPPPLPKD